MTFEVGDYVETTRRFRTTRGVVVPRHTRGEVTRAEHKTLRGNTLDLITGDKLRQDGWIEVKTVHGTYIHATPSDLTRLLRRSEVAREG